MPVKESVKRWTYSGIKAHYPGLTFADWLSICRRGDHLHSDHREVVKRIDWKNYWKNP